MIFSIKNYLSRHIFLIRKNQIKQSEDVDPALQRSLICLLLVLENHFWPKSKNKVSFADGFMSSRRKLEDTPYLFSLLLSLKSVFLSVTYLWPTCPSVDLSVVQSSMLLSEHKASSNLFPLRPSLPWVTSPFFYYKIRKFPRSGSAENPPFPLLGVKNVRENLKKGTLYNHF